MEVYAPFQLQHGTIIACSASDRALVTPANQSKTEIKLHLYPVFVSCYASIDVLGTPTPLTASGGSVTHGDGSSCRTPSIRPFRHWYDLRKSRQSVRRRSMIPLISTITGYLWLVLKPLTLVNQVSSANSLALEGSFLTNARYDSFCLRRRQDGIFILEKKQNRVVADILYALVISQKRICGVFSL